MTAISKNDINQIKKQVEKNKKLAEKSTQDKLLVGTLNKLNDAIKKLLKKSTQIDLSPIRDMMSELTKAVSITQKISEEKEKQINDLLSMVSALNSELIRLKGQKLDNVAPMIHSMEQSNRAIVTGLEEIKKEMKNRVPKKWEFEVQPPNVNGYRKITAEIKE